MCILLLHKVAYVTSLSSARKHVTNNFKIRVGYWNQRTHAFVKSNLSGTVYTAVIMIMYACVYTSIVIITCLSIQLTCHTSNMKSVFYKVVLNSRDHYIRICGFWNFFISKTQFALVLW